MNIRNTEWIQIDFSNMKIFLEPPSYQDLELILQPIEILYCTKIWSQELTDVEMEQLQIMGYIDYDNVITEKFNSSNLSVKNNKISKNFFLL